MGCTGLAPGSLVVVGIFRIIRCIATGSADCAVWCTDRVLVTLKLEYVSVASKIGTEVDKLLEQTWLRSQHWGRERPDSLGRRRLMEQ